MENTTEMIVSTPPTVFEFSVKLTGEEIASGMVLLAAAYILVSYFRGLFDSLR